MPTLVQRGILSTLALAEAIRDLEHGSIVEGIAFRRTFLVRNDLISRRKAVLSRLQKGKGRGQEQDSASSALELCDVRNL